jgi:predicted anti-sigma-YlaC factor YlaD
MRLTGTRAMLCDRTREWAALDLDGELSEFERALMQAHLDRCADCREFAGDVVQITQNLRSAPLEALARPVTLPARRRVASYRHVQVAAAAAVVLVAAGLGGLYGSVRGEEATVSAAGGHATSLAAVSEDRLVRAVQLAYLKSSALPSLGESKPALPVSI